MTNFEKLLQKNGVQNTEKPKITNVYITREDFDLLDVQNENAIYTIFEYDGSITVKKGE